MKQLVLGGSQTTNNDHSSTSGKKRSLMPECGLQYTIQQSGALEKLEEITNRILLQTLHEELLAHLRQKDPNPDWKSEYRLQQPSKKQIKRSQLQASCIICAQISGIVSTINREELVEQLAQSIQSDAEFRTIAAGGSVSVVSLSAHRTSGQIRCTFQLEDQLMSTSDHGTSPTQISPKNKKDKMGADSSSGDRLADWYLRTTGKQLQQDQRSITIHTMPAHQSALNPKVHRLYVQYQMAVHDDPNPFLGEKKPEDGNDDKSHHSPQNGHNNNNNMENHDNDRMINKDDSEDTPTHPNDLDWGNAPDYFQDRIGDILTSYLSAVPEQHQNVVLENYYSYYQFLVEAPFPLTPEQQRISSPQVTKDIPHQSNGSSTGSSSSEIKCGLYHQHYRLGDMLIAVGVVDILPAGLSSVYLFYHPTFSHDLIALGKYAILKEIEYARDTLKLPYYYLGYYIESCQKMRYKAEYKPSQLLCPKYYQWVDATVAIAKLQQTPRHVCSLIDTTATEEHETALKNDRESMALHQLQMDIGAGINVTIDMLQPSGVLVVKPILENFVAEAGPELSIQCLVKLS